MYFIYKVTVDKMNNDKIISDPCCISENMDEVANNLGFSRAKLYQILSGQRNNVLNEVIKYGNNKELESHTLTYLELFKGDKDPDVELSIVL